MDFIIPWAYIWEGLSSAQSILVVQTLLSTVVKVALCFWWSLAQGSIHCTADYCDTKGSWVEEKYTIITFRVPHARLHSFYSQARAAEQSRRWRLHRLLGTSRGSTACKVRFFQCIVARSGTYVANLPQRINDLQSTEFQWFSDTWKQMSSPSRIQERQGIVALCWTKRDLAFRVFLPSFKHYNFHYQFSDIFLPPNSQFSFMGATRALKCTLTRALNLIVCVPWSVPAARMIASIPPMAFRSRNILYSDNDGAFWHFSW